MEVHTPEQFHLDLQLLDTNLRKIDLYPDNFESALEFSFVTISPDSSSRTETAIISPAMRPICNRRRLAP